MSSYLTSINKLFAFYKKLGESAMVQVKDEQLFIQQHEDSNSIAIIIQHMSGNMLSRWTDFLNSDGEKEWRNRDAEFEQEINSIEDLMASWERGWKCFFDALETIHEDHLEKTVYIRNEAHTVTEALNRQLAHYAYHVGQIVFLSKMLAKGNWKSLSIPKNKSSEFNREKFTKEKG